jgi:hypothetical protein
MERNRPQTHPGGLSLQPGLFSQSRRPRITKRQERRLTDSIYIASTQQNLPTCREHYLPRTLAHGTLCWLKPKCNVFSIGSKRRFVKPVRAVLRECGCVLAATRGVRRDPGPARAKQTLPNNACGKAVSYTLARWNKLTLSLPNIASCEIQEAGD